MAIRDDRYAGRSGDSRDPPRAALDRRGLAAELEGARTRAAAMGLNGTLLSLAVHLARARLAQGEPAEALKVLSDPEGTFEKGDPERFLAVAAALRARAYTALRDPTKARHWLAQAESMLAQLPPQRRVETALDMARALERLGDAAGALPLAQSAARLAQTRGFRILYLDSVALAARVAHDAAESNRLSREAQQGYAQILARLPSMWQTTFRARGGGA